MARPRKLLPECTCSGEGPCEVHGIGARAKALRNAQRAIMAGKLNQHDYEAWLQKYPQPLRKKKWTDP